MEAKRTKPDTLTMMVKASRVTRKRLQRVWAVTVVLVGNLATPCLSQERIYRCGDEFIPNISQADADSRGCKLVSGGNVSTAKKQTTVKKRGVSIGMSMQDVLDSNWGRPNKVHRTITGRGTREQWVYGNGHYLYFEDGTLVTIQN